MKIGSQNTNCTSSDAKMKCNQNFVKAQQIKIKVELDMFVKKWLRKVETNIENWERENMILTTIWQITVKKKKGQAGAELCQALVNLVYPASSPGIPFRLKIDYMYFDKGKFKEN